MSTKTGPFPAWRTQTQCRVLAEGFAVEAVVSPCVFMYEGYPLQLTVTLKSSDSNFRGVAYITDRGLTAETATAADVARLLRNVRVQPCCRCRAQTFDSSTVETNRDELCESCFLDDLDRQYAIEAEREIREVAYRDRQMKSRGMKYRVTAWVHPDTGDDFPIEFYVRSAPSRNGILKRLRREDSTVLGDFAIVKL